VEEEKCGERRGIFISDDLLNNIAIMIKIVYNSLSFN
jgi:hypothetical protein